MKHWSRLALILCYLLLGLFVRTISPAVVYSQPSDVPISEDCRNLVEALLPAVGKGFEAVDLNGPTYSAMISNVMSDPNTPTVPFPMVTDDVGELPTSIGVKLSRKQLRHPAFELGTETQLGSFEGHMLGDSKSLASFFVTPNYVSGFLLVGKSWTFIEPIRPLIDLQNQVRIDAALGSLALSSVDDCFPVTSKWHIVYKADKTDFVIDLEPQTPEDSQKASHTLKAVPYQIRDRVTVNSVEFNFAAGNDMPYVPIWGLRDAAFNQSNAFLVGNMDKSPDQAQEEVFNLVDTFWEHALGIRISLVGLDTWDPKNRVKFADPVNAYNLLCAFAQQGGDNHSNSSNSLAKALHDHQKQLILGNRESFPLIVHLFTGVDLKPVPLDDNGNLIVSDSGAFCTRNCGIREYKIVGLAEGVGGVFNDRSNGCATQELTPAGHHSLSQQLPDASSLDCQPNCSGPNKNLQAILLQRFLLVAHELGHNLGALHTDSNDPDTVMSSPLQNIPSSANITNITTTFDPGSSRDIRDDRNFAKIPNRDRILDCLTVRSCASELQSD